MYIYIYIYRYIYIYMNKLKGSIALLVAQKAFTASAFHVLCFLYIYIHIYSTMTVLPQIKEKKTLLFL